MANPQIENGFTKIANEIMEALAGIRISGEARQCLDVIIRKTYGFNKKEDQISLSQFCLLTKMSKVLVCRSLLKLAKMNLIISKKANQNNKNINIYGINKNFDTWKPLAKKLTISKKANDLEQKSSQPLAKKLHTKDNSTKETITKDILRSSEPSSQNQINQIMDIFYKINPSLNFGNITQRKAIEWMTKKWGIEKVKAITEYAISIQGQQYAPVITTPFQLKDKIAALKIYKEKELNNKLIIEL